MSIWDDKKWRRMQFDLQEAEQQQQQGDEKLTQMVTSMTDYVMSIQTYSYFNKYIKQKYKFNPGSMESKPGERINKVNKGE